MEPMSALRTSRIVEIPANWHLHDWLPFHPEQGFGGFVDTATVERVWKQHFDFLYRECPEDGSFIFPISIHPQVSGKPQIMLLHERFIEWINEHEGIEWVPMEQIVDEFKAGTLPGITVEGGVDVSKGNEDS